MITICPAWIASLLVLSVCVCLQVCTLQVNKTQASLLKPMWPLTLAHQSRSIHITCPHTYTRIHYFLLLTIKADNFSNGNNKVVWNPTMPQWYCLCTFPTILRLKDIWHFNSTLLSESRFIDFMEEQISTFLEIKNSPERPSLIVWGTLTAYLRSSRMKQVSLFSCQYFSVQVNVYN